MKPVKAILKRVLCLPPLATVLISLPSFTLVIYVLATDTQGPLAYVGYGLSAYAMAVTTTGIIRVVRAVRGAAGADESGAVRHGAVFGAAGGRL